MNNCPRFARHIPRPLRVIGAILIGIVLICAFALAAGVLVKALWNWLMPPLFGLGTITFWQGFGIMVLAQLLFGGHISRKGDDSHDKRHYRKWNNHEPVPEGPLFDEWWQKEGRDAFETHIKSRCAEHDEAARDADEKERPE